MIGIYLLTITTEILRFLLVFHGFLGFTYRKGIYKYILILIASTAFCLLRFVPELDTLYLSVIIIIINFFTTLSLFREKIKILLKIYICISVVFVTWDNLFIQVLSLFYEFNETVTIGALLQQLLCNVILIIILASTWIIIKRLGLLHKLNYSHLSYTVYFLFLSSAALSAYINSLAYIIYENMIPEKTGISYVSMIALSILFQIICVTLIFLFYSREQYKRLNRLREEYSEKQIDYYKTLLNQEEDTKKFRHDIRNHIICIEELLETGKLEDVKGYVRDIHQRLGEISCIHDTGNDIINAIINYYANKGREEHISIQVKGRILQDLNIPLMHLGTIVSNLISNAYEAAVKVDSEQNKMINIEIRSGSKYLEFIIQNPTITDRERLDERTTTSKADHKNHGFGIQNIKDVLSKYDGEFQLRDDLDHVTARVTMKIA